MFQRWYRLWCQSGSQRQCRENSKKDLTYVRQTRKMYIKQQFKIKIFKKTGSLVVQSCYSITERENTCETPNLIDLNQLPCNDNKFAAETYLLNHTECLDTNRFSFISFNLTLSIQLANISIHSGSHTMLCASQDDG